MHSRNRFLLWLKFVVTIKKGGKRPNNSFVTESNKYNSPTVEKHVLCCKKPLVHVAGSDLTELGCGWNAGDRKRLHVVGGFFFSKRTSRAELRVSLQFLTHAALNGHRLVNQRAQQPRVADETGLKPPDLEGWRQVKACVSIKNREEMHTCWLNWWMTETTVMVMWGGG